MCDSLFVDILFLTKYAKLRLYYDIFEIVEVKLEFVMFYNQNCFSLLIILSQFLF